MTNDPSPHDRADVESCREFAREIFGLPRLLDDIRPTYADLDYLRAHGEHFPGPPGLHGHRRGKEGECWRNAMQATFDNSKQLTYVQGFVIGSMTQVVAHAWCVDRDDRLVELTWDVAIARGDERYFGVRFTREQLADLVLAYGTYDWYEGFSAVVAPSSSLGGDRRG